MGKNKNSNKGQNSRKVDQRRRRFNMKGNKAKHSALSAPGPVPKRSEETNAKQPEVTTQHQLAKMEPSRSVQGTPSASQLQIETLLPVANTGQSSALTAQQQPEIPEALQKTRQNEAEASPEVRPDRDSDADLDAAKIVRDVWEGERDVQNGVRAVEDQETAGDDALPISEQVDELNGGQSKAADEDVIDLEGDFQILMFEDDGDNPIDLSEDGEAVPTENEGRARDVHADSFRGVLPDLLRQEFVEGQGARAGNGAIHGEQEGRKAGRQGMSANQRRGQENQEGPFLGWPDLYKNAARFLTKTQPQKPALPLQLQQSSSLPPCSDFVYDQIFSVLDQLEPPKDESELGRETAILRAILYKNNSQFRRVIAFKHLQEVAKLLTAIEDAQTSCLIQELLHLCKPGIAEDERSSVPSGEAIVLLLQRLKVTTKMCVSLCHALRKAALQLLPHIARGHFLKMYTALLALLARSQVYVGSMAMSHLQSYNTLIAKARFFPFRSSSGSLTGEDLPQMLTLSWQGTTPSLATIPFDSNDTIPKQARLAQHIQGRGRLKTPNEPLSSDLMVHDEGPGLDLGQPMSAEEQLQLRAKMEADRSAQIADRQKAPPMQSAPVAGQSKTLAPSLTVPNTAQITQPVVDEASGSEAVQAQPDLFQGALHPKLFQSMDKGMSAVSVPGASFGHHSGTGNNLQMATGTSLKLGKKERAKAKAQERKERKKLNRIKRKVAQGFEGVPAQPGTSGLTAKQPDSQNGVAISNLPIAASDLLQAGQEASAALPSTVNPLDAGRADLTNAGPLQAAIVGPSTLPGGSNLATGAVVSAQAHGAGELHKDASTTLHRPVEQTVQTGDQSSAVQAQTPAPQPPGIRIQQVQHPENGGSRAAQGGPQIKSFASKLSSFAGRPKVAIAGAHQATSRAPLSGFKPVSKDTAAATFANTNTLSSDKAVPPNSNAAVGLAVEKTQGMSSGAAGGMLMRGADVSPSTAAEEPIDLSPDKPEVVSQRGNNDGFATKGQAETHDADFYKGKSGSKRDREPSLAPFLGPKPVCLTDSPTAQSSPPATTTPSPASAAPAKVPASGSQLLRPVSTQQVRDKTGLPEQTSISLSEGRQEPGLSEDLSRGGALKDGDQPGTWRASPRSASAKRQRLDLSDGLGYGLDLEGQRLNNSQEPKSGRRHNVEQGSSIKDPDPRGDKQRGKRTAVQAFSEGQRALRRKLDSQLGINSALTFPESQMESKSLQMNAAFKGEGGWLGDPNGCDDSLSLPDISEGGSYPSTASMTPQSPSRGSAPIRLNSPSWPAHSPSKGAAPRRLSVPSPSITSPCNDSNRQQNSDSQPSIGMRIGTSASEILPGNPSPGIGLGRSQNPHTSGATAPRKPVLREQKGQPTQAIGQRSQSEANGGVPTIGDLVIEGAALQPAELPGNSHQPQFHAASTGTKFEGLKPSEFLPTSVSFRATKGDASGSPKSGLEQSLQERETAPLKPMPKASLGPVIKASQGAKNATPVRSTGPAKRNLEVLEASKKRRKKNKKNPNVIESEPAENTNKAWDDLLQL